MFHKNQEKKKDKEKRSKKKEQEKRSKKKEKEKRSKKQEKRSKKSEKRHDSATKRRTKKHKSESEPMTDTNEAKQVHKKTGISNMSVGSNVLKTGSETKPTKYKKLRFFNFIGSPKSNSELS